MAAQAKDVARITELTISVTATIKGSVSAMIKLRTPEPALALTLAVVAVTGVSAVMVAGALMLPRGRPRQQSADLALTEDDDSGHSPQRP
jgi:hypothetical protein